MERKGRRIEYRGRRAGCRADGSGVKERVTEVQLKGFRISEPEGRNIRRECFTFLNRSRV